jgi:HK97 family phage major capsid protein
MKATALREQAFAKLKEAQALVGPDEDVKAEDQDQFTALMAEFTELDDLAAKASTSEDGVGTLRDRMEWYTAKATGSPLRLRETVLDPSLSMSIGQQFVQSEAYAALKASGALASQRGFKSDPFIAGPSVARLWRASAATTDVIQTGSGGPANALVLPQYLPGILPLPQRDLTVRALFSQGSTESDTVSYAQQNAFSSGAATVKQASSVSGSGTSGGVKPQSSIGWERKTSPVETIATWMVTTRQALADAGQVAALIDNQGRLMIQLEEEDQLLNGDGTSPNLSGIFDQSILTLDASGEGLDNLDAVRRARRLIRTGVSRASADAIVLNPADSEAFDLLKDDNGLYRGGNPIGNFGYGQPIWGLRRVESEAIDEGTALIGAFNLGATVLERQPITVYTADQHSDFFVRNLVVILFEERLGFPVYWPSAFLELTLADFGS